MRLPPTRLLVLYLAIFPLEPAILLLDRHSLLHEVLRPLFLVQSAAVPLCRPFDDSTSLRECGHLAFPAVFLVVPVWVEDGAHLEELEIAF